VSKKLDHIGIAVPELTAALEVYESALGFELEEIEEVPAQKTRVAFVRSGDIRLELLEAMNDASPVSKFIAKRGPGIHHICFQVEDIAAELTSLKAAGVRLIDETARPGAAGCLVAFIHPAGTGGVLLELSQHLSPSKQSGTE
jgi:methylmalonyl-CoA/ethylmalonyl-CoA epimerase